jgi:hypothetical protein
MHDRVVVPLVESEALQLSAIMALPIVSCLFCK